MAEHTEFTACVPSLEVYMLPHVAESMTQTHELIIFPLLPMYTVELLNNSHHWEPTFWPL